MALTSRSSRAGRLAVITYGHLVVDMYGGFLPPLIPVLREHLGVKLSAMTTLAGVCMVVVNGIQPLTGLAPRASGRWGLLIGPVLAMTLALTGVSRDFAVVAALALVGYAGVGLYHPRGLLAAHALSGSRENVGVPIFLSGGFFGVSLAGVVSTQWVSRFGLGSFWVLAAAGISVAVLCGAAGLHRRATHRRRHDAPSSQAKSAPHFGLIFALGVVMVSTTCVLLVFLNEDLKSRWGPAGIRWGGAAYALIGLSGALASFVWGYLSGRVSPFALMAAGQAACAPLYWQLVHAETGPALLAWSVPAGVVMGSAFFPVLATVSRRCGQLTPQLRAGLVIGGVWGCASLVPMGWGFLTDYGVTPGEILRWMTPAVAASAGLALAVHLLSGRRTAGN